MMRLTLMFAMAMASLVHSLPARASTCGEGANQGSFDQITDLAMQMRKVGGHYLAKPQDLAGEALNSDAVHATLDQTFPFTNEDNCNTTKSKKDPVSPGWGSASYFVCTDGSISFDQPDSEGWNGYEGFCGQTAVTNVAAMLCGRSFDPKKVDRYESDYGPGSSPDTLVSAANQIFDESPQCSDYKWSRSWKNEGSYWWYPSDFLRNLKNTLYSTSKPTINRKRRAADGGGTYIMRPVPILLEKGLGYHWVTVVDIIDNSKGCKVILNTWGRQKSMSCSDLAKYANTAGLGYNFLSWK